MGFIPLIFSKSRPNTLVVGILIYAAKFVLALHFPTPFMNQNVFCSVPRSLYVLVIPYKNQFELNGKFDIILEVIGSTVYWKELL